MYSRVLNPSLSLIKIVPVCKHKDKLAGHTQTPPPKKRNNQFLELLLKELEIFLKGIPTTFEKIPWNKDKHGHKKLSYGNSRANPRTAPQWESKAKIIPNADKSINALLLLCIQNTHLVSFCTCFFNKPFIFPESIKHPIVWGHNCPIKFCMFPSGHLPNQEIGAPKRPCRFQVLPCLVCIFLYKFRSQLFQSISMGTHLARLHLLYLYRDYFFISPM